MGARRIFTREYRCLRFYQYLTPSLYKGTLDSRRFAMQIQTLTELADWPKDFELSEVESRNKIVDTPIGQALIEHFKQYNDVFESKKDAA